MKCIKLEYDESSETKLICIDAVTDILKFGSGKPELTYGKEYKVLKWFPKLDDGRQFIGIRNDSDVLNEYLITRFVAKDIFRDIKINSILND